VKAFVDTSAFLAFLISEDGNHKRAVNAWERARKAKDRLVTTNYVIVETCSLLHGRYGAPAMRTFLEKILPTVLVEWVDLQLHMQGVSAVVTSGRRGPSIVDCVSFAAMRRLNIEYAFAFDRHFREQGFESL
jgi:uncharacterized protein